MSIFKDTDQLKDAVRGILSSAPDVNTAKRWIQALPGPSTVRGLGGMVTDALPITSHDMHFDILGDIVVIFVTDARSAAFTIAREHDDPNPERIGVVWVPNQTTDPPQT